MQSGGKRIALILAVPIIFLLICMSGGLVVERLQNATQTIGQWTIGPSSYRGLKELRFKNLRIRIERDERIEVVPDSTLYVHNNTITLRQELLQPIELKGEFAKVKDSMVQAVLKNYSRSAFDFEEETVHAGSPVFSAGLYKAEDGFNMRADMIEREGYILVFISFSTADLSDTSKLPLLFRRME